MLLCTFNVPDPICPKCFKTCPVKYEIAKNDGWFRVVSVCKTCSLEGPLFVEAIRIERVEGDLPEEGVNDGARRDPSEN